MEFQNTLKTLVLFPILKDSLQTGPYAVNIEMFVVNLHWVLYHFQAPHSFNQPSLYVHI